MTDLVYDFDVRRATQLRIQGISTAQIAATLRAPEHQIIEAIAAELIVDRSIDLDRWRTLQQQLGDARLELGLRPMLAEVQRREPQLSPEQEAAMTVEERVLWEGMRLALFRSKMGAAQTIQKLVDTQAKIGGWAAPQRISATVDLRDQLLNMIDDVQNLVIETTASDASDG